MRELYDPVYYPPTIHQGYDNPYHHPQQHVNRHNPHRSPQRYSIDQSPPRYQQPTSILKSSKSRNSNNSSNNSQHGGGSSASKSSVLGKFLKLGKSKSDANVGAFSSSSSHHGFSSTFSAFSSSASVCGSTRDREDVDNFTLSSSLNRSGTGGGGGDRDRGGSSSGVGGGRGPVQKMVHKANSRKDVSRSHSWIYGSVKLPSDLPFGYGEHFVESGEVEEPDAENSSSIQRAPGSSGHYLHTHSLHTMQIPRCQLDYMGQAPAACTCDCLPGDMGAMGAGGSVRGARFSKPCQGCARDMAMRYAVHHTGKTRRSGSSGLVDTGGGVSESFVSSVKKLTWKSLKQVVKKRPSLDTLKKMTPSTSSSSPQHQPLPSEYHSTSILPMPYLSPSAVAAATATGQESYPSPNANPLANLNSHYGQPRLAVAPAHATEELNYFFPEKKSFYSSCNDIYDCDPQQQPPPQHVTASVRLRPKRTRQPWQFPNSANPNSVSSEFGPVPNYEEETEDKQSLYHSEWDLRHVMSYDVWMNTTSNVKPRPAGSISGGSSEGRDGTRHYHSSGNLHVPPPDYSLETQRPSTFRPARPSAKNGSGSLSKSTERLTTVPLLSPVSLSSSKSTGSISGSIKKSSLKSSSSSSHKRASLSTSSLASADTLSIATFAGTPGGRPERPSSSASSAIVKRGSILAADVTAYQLLKQQSKNLKAKGQAHQDTMSLRSVSSVKSTSSSRSNVTMRKQEQELEDAFSESSDDLSDNAVTSSMAMSSPSPSVSTNSHSSSNTRNSEAKNPKAGVRIAGQGIRVMPNSTSNGSSQSSKNVMSTSTLTSRSKQRTTTSTPTHSPSHPKSVTSAPRTPSRQSNSSMTSLNSNGHSSNFETKKASVKNATLTPQNVQAQPSSRLVPVPCPSVDNQIQRQSQSQSRPQMVTFDGSRKSAEVQQSQTVTFQEQNDLEFEEYEVGDSRESPPIPTSDGLTPLSSSRNDNVVCLTISGGSGGNINPMSNSNAQSHPSYIKHTKGQNSSTSSVAQTGKFGALRRRKSRSGSGGPNTGKLLQETIYEEDSEASDHQHEQKHHHHQKSPPKGAEHSVKIQVPQPTSGVITSSGNTHGQVKPILKKERTYDTPLTPMTSQDTDNHYSMSQAMDGRYNQMDSQNDGSNSEIYFDSSVSTASKKKVQFDQSQVMVCGGDTSGDSFDENDDSDQWSAKSEDDDHHEGHQNNQKTNNNQAPLPNPPIQPMESMEMPSKRPRSTFEEEVAAKAASFAKSRAESERRRQADAEKAEAEAEKEKNEAARKKKESEKVTPTPFLVQLKKVTQQKQQQQNSGVTTNTGVAPIKLKSALKSSKTSSLNQNQGQSSTPSFDSGMTEVNHRILNPNSLLFHDTTRIRLNQSRPALHDSTFKLPNVSSSSPTQSKKAGGGVGGGVNRRLKQSNSFRSVSMNSAPLRPRVPPPPPPTSTLTSKSNTPQKVTGQGSVTSAVASVPARLQKALSTSTLLSKSTEKLNLVAMNKEKDKSHYGYGTGGKLLPSKSQISLPMGFTTTSKTAGLLASGSMESLAISNESPQSSVKLRGNAKSHLMGSKRHSTPNLAARSKSLTDRCEALEKVLKEQKSFEDFDKTLPKHDIHSKNIEIVTKENSVSEIRIYSASNSNMNLSTDENLPYQGIIYETSKTLINAPPPSSIISTTSSSNNVQPQPPKSPLPPVPTSNKHSEMHYAATDLFPASTPLPNPPKSPITSKPFSHPPLPPIPKSSPPETPEASPGKSVVLIIDNSNKNKKVPTSKPTVHQKPDLPLTNYSQPLDSISGRGPPPSKGLPPLPSIPMPTLETLQTLNSSLDFTHFQQEDEEPLYDDVINHSIDSSAPTRPLPVPKGAINNKAKPPQPQPPPHQLGELPPLPAPPVPPHKTPTTPSSQSQGQIVSSTLPCLACPPTLPPPNLPSKSLSEFHNRPLVIQENEEDTIVSSSATPANYHSFPPLPAPPPGEHDDNDDDDVNNLYNDIGVKDNVNEDEMCDGEPLYDDVLNLTASNQDKVKNEVNSQKSEVSQTGSGSEYHSSTCSDSGTEDLPPPLPAQGPPPLSKAGSNELSLITFPLLEPPSKNAEQKQKPEAGNPVANSRNLFSELNEKLSKLNPPTQLVTSVTSVTPSSAQNNPSPGSSSLSSDRSSDNFGPFHNISKVVISPSSESSGVEEDYSVSNASGSGSDNDDKDKTSVSLNNENVYKSSKGAAVNKSTDLKDSSGAPKDSISLARGKFLENMKVNMLAGQGQNQPQGLLMIQRSGNGPLSVATEEMEDEPIYEEIGEKSQSQGQSTKVVASSGDKRSTVHGHEVMRLFSGIRVADEDEELEECPGDGGRGTQGQGQGSGSGSASPIYADAFDAKSMFDGASRSEILSFLESIRDRLTGAESASSSDSKSSSIRSSAQTPIATGTINITTGVNSGASGSCLVAVPLPVLDNNENEKSSEITLKRAPSLNFRSCPDCNGNHNDYNNDNVNDSNDATVGIDTTVRSGMSLFGNEDVESQQSSSLCKSCNRKRNEKREIIMEIYETELKYGRDLRIVLEEFYKPIQVAGLLTKEQLDQIFLNVEELMKINHELTARLKGAIQEGQSGAKMEKDLEGSGGMKPEEKSGAVAEVDEKMEVDVNVGKIFLELGESMMTAFENYCTRQASAGALLSQLEKEKELLRIFLRVSQMENTVLRRMNLPAFLMVPVQRVTRYPLLLSRLLKVTPLDHSSRDELQSAHEQIEQHLEHMNKTTREVASVKLWRRISMINSGSSSNVNNSSGQAHRRSNSDLDTSNIRIRKMAMDVLDWANFSDVTCIMDNQLGGVHFNGKLLRHIYGCVLARGKDLEQLTSKILQSEDPFFPPATEDVVKDVKFVLVRVKNTRFCLLREPLCLSKCVVSQGENEFQDFIEINEITTKNTYFIQGTDKQSTATWLKLLQCYSSCVGHWRRRRPALANIMMNGMIKHL